MVLFPRVEKNLLPDRRRTQCARAHDLPFHDARRKPRLQRDAAGCFGRRESPPAFGRNDSFRARSPRAHGRRSAGRHRKTVRLRTVTVSRPFGRKLEARRNRRPPNLARRHCVAVPDGGRDRLAPLLPHLRHGAPLFRHGTDQRATMHARDERIPSSKIPKTCAFFYRVIAQV